MKAVEEYLSTILTDPDLSRRLAEVVEKLGRGRSLDEALREAGLDRRRADVLIEEVTRLLRGRAPSENEKTPSGRSALKIVAFCDGGSRGNPGPAACAAVLYDGENNELLRRAKRIGTATNNVAEYEGVILALELARELGADDLLLKLDSELVVRQIQGSYRVKSEALKPYHGRALELASAFVTFSVEHVRRADNRVADSLINATLDGKEP